MTFLYTDFYVVNHLFKIIYVILMEIMSFQKLQMKTSSRCLCLFHKKEDFWNLARSRDRIFSKLNCSYYMYTDFELLFQIANKSAQF